MGLSPTPKENHLPADIFKGWVTSNDLLVLVEWKTIVQAPSNHGYKAFCERIAAEAAVMKGYHSVLILQRVHTQSLEPRTRTYNRHMVVYDPHITVRLFGEDFTRRAHIYVGPWDTFEKEMIMDVSKLRIWRRQDKPAVVLC